MKVPEFGLIFLLALPFKTEILTLEIVTFQLLLLQVCLQDIFS